MAMENKEVIDLLEKAKFSNNENDKYTCGFWLDQAIALLKPCKTCGACAEKPESQEPGLAESDYMSIEQREKFEAKNIPEKVETSKFVGIDNQDLLEVYRTLFDSIPFIPFSVAQELCNRLEAAEKDLAVQERITVKQIEENKQLKAKLEAAEEDLLIMTNNRNHFEKQVEQLQAKLEALKE